MRGVRDDAPRDADDPRRQRLLDAAFAVFCRYGFRKTSMEEIARAADLSRQALYLRFETKEALFRATLQHALDAALGAAQARLGDGDAPLDARLVGAFDAWVGRFVGALGADAVDLEETSGALAGPVIPEYDGRFVDAVAKALRGAGLAGAYGLPGLTAKQLASTLYATARGLKHSCKTRAEFVAELSLAARLLCAPLRRDG